MLQNKENKTLKSFTNLQRQPHIEDKQAQGPAP